MTDPTYYKAYRKWDHYCENGSGRESKGRLINNYPTGQGLSAEELTKPQDITKLEAPDHFHICSGGYLQTHGENHFFDFNRLSLIDFKDPRTTSIPLEFKIVDLRGVGFKFDYLSTLQNYEQTGDSAFPEPDDNALAFKSLFESLQFFERDHLALTLPELSFPVLVRIEKGYSLAGYPYVYDEDWENKDSHKRGEQMNVYVFQQLNVLNYEIPWRYAALVQKIIECYPPKLSGNLREDAYNMFKIYASIDSKRIFCQKAALHLKIFRDYLSNFPRMIPEMRARGHMNFKLYQDYKSLRIRQIYNTNRYGEYVQLFPDNTEREVDTTSRGMKRKTNNNNNDYYRSKSTNEGVRNVVDDNRSKPINDKKLNLCALTQLHFQDWLQSKFSYETLTYCVPLSNDAGKETLNIQSNRAHHMITTIQSLHDHLCKQLSYKEDYLVRFATKKIPPPTLKHFFSVIPEDVKPVFQECYQAAMGITCFTEYKELYPYDIYKQNYGDYMDIETPGNARSGSVSINNNINNNNDVRKPKQQYVPDQGLHVQLPVANSNAKSNNKNNNNDANNNNSASRDMPARQSQADRGRQNFPSMSKKFSLEDSPDSSAKYLSMNINKQSERNRNAINNTNYHPDPLFESMYDDQDQGQGRKISNNGEDNNRGFEPIYDDDPPNQVRNYTGSNSNMRRERVDDNVINRNSNQVSGGGVKGQYGDKMNYEINTNSNNSSNNTAAKSNMKNNATGSMMRDEGYDDRGNNNYNYNTNTSTNTNANNNSNMNPNQMYKGAKDQYNNNNNNNNAREYNNRNTNNSMASNNNLNSREQGANMGYSQAGDYNQDVDSSPVSDYGQFRGPDSDYRASRQSNMDYNDGYAPNNASNNRYTINNSNEGRPTKHQSVYDNSGNSQPKAPSRSFYVNPAGPSRR
jgi:hypothetical protein